MAESRSLLILSCEEPPGSVLEHLRAQGLTVICSDSPLQTSALLVKQPPDALYVSLTGLHDEEHEIVALARQHAPRALLVLGLLLVGIRRMMNANMNKMNLQYYYQQFLFEMQMILIVQ